MDVYCQNCGEPWDVYHVNHEFDEDEKDWFQDGFGCPSCVWGLKGGKQKPLRAMLAKLAKDHSGGDLEDFAADCDLIK